MSTPESIRAGFERNQQALALRPGKALGTATTRARVTQGLVCEVEEGPFRLVVDGRMRGEKDPSAANPGSLARGALASCLAIGYATWAAVLDVPIDGIEVQVEADYDARGIYAAADVPAGYAEVRYNVTITSNAPASDIQRVLDKADAHSPLVDVFARPQQLKRTVHIVPPEA